MTKALRKGTRVVALDLHPQRYGYAVLETPAALLDWGVRRRFRKSESSRDTSSRRGICSSKPDYSPNSKYHSSRFPQTRTVSEAKVWLHWTDSERVAFVRGLVIGYRQGNSDVCNAVTGVSVTQGNCRQRTEQLPSSALALIMDDTVNGYSKAMTGFYANHPEDDDVPLTVLFGWLVFERKTPTEVHNFLTPRNL